MDRIMSELFGGGEAEAAPAPRAETTGKAADPEREARREARQRRKADAEARRSRKEFVERYTTGDPSEGFTTEEAITHLREMRDELSPGEFRRAMERTLENLPPSQRDDFIRIMQEYQAGSAQPGSGVATPGASVPASTAAPSGVDESAAAPGSRTTSADPFGGLLTGLMGGSAAGAGGVGVGDLFDDLTKGGLRAPSATPGEKPTEADFHALLNSPLARAVLGGVAAYGIQGLEEDEEPGTPSGTGSHG
jgi:hypothetical protein